MKNNAFIFKKRDWPIDKKDHKFGMFMSHFEWIDVAI